ncbi:MAG: 3-deoxy-D-manno-octulosonic acid transferase [Alphaproteobacteria bacterium]
MIWPAYRAATTLAGPLVEAYLRRRERRGREDPARRGERRGAAGRPRPPGRLIWMHAASVGESLSVLPLVNRVLERDPAASVLVTTGTVTSARLMAERLPARALHQYVPVDRAAWVRRFLDHWRPDAALWVESEFWPNLVLETHRRGVPMALVNARMSDASARSWRRIPGAARALLRCFAVSLAQTDRVAGILAGLGAAPVRVVGNLKMAAAPLPADPVRLQALHSAIGARPVWLAASTHPGEERLVAEVHAALAPRIPDLLTLVAPRHPGRGAEVAALLRATGLGVARRSADEPIVGRTGFYLADTIGEMGLFYRLARAAFVGGSWIDRGGQNPYEPAQLGCPVLVGPAMWNFPEISGLLLDAGAARQVDGPAACAAALAELLQDSAAHDAMAAAAHRLVADQSGVLDRLEAALYDILYGAGPPPRRDPMPAGRSAGHARA